MSREAVLGTVRKALGRDATAMPPPLPPPMLSVEKSSPDVLVKTFVERFELLAGKAVRVRSTDAAESWLRQFLAGRTGVASNSSYLADCSVHDIEGVSTGFRTHDALKAACAKANVGITSADYVLADTGTLVMVAGPQEARLISLLPPIHIAIFPQSRILSGLDQLFTLLPAPAEQTSSMVLITGPSRTADIEQILVRGVHGPGEIYAVIVES